MVCMMSIANVRGLSPGLRSGELLACRGCGTGKHILSELGGPVTKIQCRIISQWVGNGLGRVGISTKVLLKSCCC